METRKKGEQRDETEENEPFPSRQDISQQKDETLKQGKNVQDFL